VRTRGAAAQSRSNDALFAGMAVAGVTTAEGSPAETERALRSPLGGGTPHAGPAFPLRSPWHDVTRSPGLLY